MADVVWTHDGFIKTMVEEELLAPLNEAFERMQVDLDDVPAGMLAYGLFDGQYYFAPRDHSQMVTYVNTTLLENEGIEMPGDDWTWEQALDIARDVTKRDATGNITQSGISKSINWLPNWHAFAVGLGGYPLVNAETKQAEFSRPETIEAIRTILDLMKEGVIMNEYIDPQGLFDKGEAAFFFGVRPHLGTVTAWAETSGFEFDLLPFPELPKGRAIGSGTSGYAANAHSKHLEEATNFAAFLLTYDGHKAFAENMLDAVPLLKSVQSEAFWKEVPQLEGKNAEAYVKYQESTIDRVTDIYLNVAAQQEAAGFGALLGAYIDGEKSLEDILQEVDLKVNGYQSK